MSQGRTTVIKNASVMMASQLITWALAMLATVFLPRYLGAEAIGEFALANSLWIIMSIFIGFGMDTLLIKEIARQPERTSTLVGTALILRCVFFLLTCIPVAIYIRLMNFSTPTIYIVWLFGLVCLITQLTSPFQAALQGLEAMHYISIAGIVGKFINTTLVLVAVFLGYGIYAISFVYIGSSLVVALMVLVFLSRYHKPQFHFNLAPSISVIKASAPYLLSSVGLVIYGQVDVLIISSLINTTELGWYSAAWQLFGTLLFIPSVFATAVFPILTRTHANTPDLLPMIQRKTFDLMLLTSIPLGLGLFVIADQIAILLFGPAFMQSGPILALLGIVLIFTYQNMLIGQYFISTDRQSVWTVVMLIAAAVTVPLDLVLVPWCQQAFGNGAIAGSISFIVTELGMVVLGIKLLPKGTLDWSNVRVGARILLAGLGMVAAIWWLRETFIVIPIIVGAIAYVGLIALMRVVPAEDIAVLKQMAQGIMRKLRRREAEPVGITGV